MTYPCSLLVGYSAVTSLTEEGHEGGGGREGTVSHL